MRPHPYWRYPEGTPDTRYQFVVEVSSNGYAGFTEFVAWVMDLYGAKGWRAQYLGFVPVNSVLFATDNELLAVHCRLRWG